MTYKVRCLGFTEGWAEAEGAKQINILLFDPLAVAAPVVYDVSMLSAPSAQSKGKYLYYERYYYDVYALNQRLPGIFANITGTQTIGKVSFTTAQGSSGKTVLNGLESLPNGQAYVAKAGTGAETVNYGDKLTAGWTIVTDGAELAAASGNTVTVAVVNTTKGNAATAVGTALAVVA